MDTSILASTVKTEETKCSNNSCAYVRKSKNHPCDDSALLFANEKYTLMGIFDGVSGETNAANASETALRAIANYVEKNIAKKTPEELLENAIPEANYAVQSGGTTASIALVLNDGNFFYANVGDSHIYKLSKGKIKRVTKENRDTSSFASYIATRNYLSQCIGGILSKIDSGKGKLEKGDALFAMSDGFIDNLFVKVEGGAVTDTSGREDLERMIKGENSARAIADALAEEVKKRMEIKEEVIDNGILVPKEDDASIVVFVY